jgi:hypothetical protein
MSDFDDFFDDDFGWDDAGILFALAEEMSEEEKERLRLEREMDKEMNESCCNEDDEEPDP